MSLTAALAVFFIIWWMVLFAVLPWGVRSQEEEGEVAPGTASSAPVAPRLRTKFLITTVVAALLFALVYAIIAFELIGFDDIPFLPDFTKLR